MGHVAEVTKAFVSADTEVMQQELGAPSEARQIAVRGGAYRTDDVTVVIGLADS